MKKKVLPKKKEMLNQKTNAKVAPKAEKKKADPKKKKKR